MTLDPVIVFLGGLVVIIVGAEMLLRSASRLAVALGISPIVIGLTIVSVGTSAPELAVGITAGLEGKGPLAVGNIAGTNIVNILLILGLSALMRPLPTRLLSTRLDVPVMIASALALIVVSWDGLLSQMEGVLLMLAAVIYTVAVVQLSRLEPPLMQQEFKDEFSEPPAPQQTSNQRKAWNAVLLIVGMALTVLGAELLVSGAVDLAKAFGVSDAFIGLTIVAIGTSAPELVTTLIATWKNERDVAIGNLIGSSVYNILFILGLSCAVVPGGIDVSQDVLWIDMPVAAAVAIVCLPVFKSDQLVSRREGAFFVVAYLLYLTMLVTLRT